MATYWENSCSFGLRCVSWYRCLIVSLVFSHLGFWSGNLFLIAPFPDLCLLVPFFLQQGYRYHKFQKIFSKFSRRHCEFISKYTVTLKKLLGEGLSEPEFYGDLIYKFKKLIGRNGFSFQLRKIITRYRRIGYNLNVMRQSACLVFNPIMVDNYAAFFNCTPVGRASDSVMAPT